jgi:hypothetical protein
VAEEEEQGEEALNQGWMSQNAVTQSTVRQCAGHGDLHSSHDFARTHAKGGESKNALASISTKAFRNPRVSDSVVARITASIGILNRR